MKSWMLVSSIVLLTLSVVLVGCGGNFGPTLPSPDGETDVGRSTIATDSQGELLPDGLTATQFAVTIDGNPAEVRQVIPARTGGVSICFILDSTGSMGGEIRGVIDSIAAFAAGFTGFDVYWSGIEYGDATPSDGVSAWDFFGEERARTLVDVTQNLADLQAWLAPIVASGGGDNPENPLKALMEVKNTFRWPAGLARHFIILTDVGAHQRIDGPTDPADEGRPDGEPFCPYMGSEVLAAFRGWGVIHAVSPDFSEAWTGASAAQANDDRVRPQVIAGYDGWDVRELADGGPPAARTHGGTGGKWTELPSSGNVDLTTLGIADLISQSYTVIYQRPAGQPTGRVVITVNYLDSGTPKVATFDLGVVTF